VKNSETEAYKLQGKVHSNKRETRKYKEPHEEQTTDANACQHILNEKEKKEIMKNDLRSIVCL
jgi:hypothetical protein